MRLNPELNTSGRPYFRKRPNNHLHLMVYRFLKPIDIGLIQIEKRIQRRAQKVV